MSEEGPGFSARDRRKGNRPEKRPLPEGAVKGVQVPIRGRIKKGKSKPKGSWEGRPSLEGR